MSLTPFTLTLLKHVEEHEGPSSEKPLLGMARRLSTENSKWKIPAHRVLLSLITHAPDPEYIVREFWEELKNCGNTSILSLCQLHYFCVMLNLRSSQAWRWRAVLLHRINIR